MHERIDTIRSAARNEFRHRDREESRERGRGELRVTQTALVASKEETEMLRVARRFSGAFESNAQMFFTPRADATSSFFAIFAIDAGTRNDGKGIPSSLRLSLLTCAEGVRRLGGVDRVMILQELHLCEILDDRHPRIHPCTRPSSRNPQLRPDLSRLSLWRRATGPALRAPVVLVTARSFTASRSPSMPFFRVCTHKVEGCSTRR